MGKNKMHTSVKTSHSSEEKDIPASFLREITKQQQGIMHEIEKLRWELYFSNINAMREFSSLKNNVMNEMRSSKHDVVDKIHSLQIDLINNIGSSNIPFTDKIYSVKNNIISLKQDIVLLRFDMVSAYLLT